MPAPVAILGLNGPYHEPASDYIEAGKKLKAATGASK